MKKVLYVVGAGLVVGAVAATFYFWNNKKKKKHLRRLVSIKTLMTGLRKKKMRLQQMSLLPKMSRCMRMLRVLLSEVCIPDMKLQPPS